MANILKKSIDPDNDQAGSIEYRFKDDPSKCSGVFVTTYYFREDDAFQGQDAPWVKTDVYKVGIIRYLEVTEQPGFEGWKLVIYLDQYSWENPVFKTTKPTERTERHEREWNRIVNHPNVVFAVVDWPEYAVGSKNDGKTIDNAVLRALRMKTFTDFPDIPVFVRDADTLFENLIKSGGGTTSLDGFTEKLALWEKTLWDNIKPIFAAGPYKILIASQPNYHRQWHVHPETGINTSGCYAAITSSLGGIAEMSDNSYWRGCLKYLRQTTQVQQVGNERKPSNLQKPTYIGKDEQLLSYVMIPMMLSKVYFYYFEYVQVEGGPVVDTPETQFAKMLLAKGITQYPSPYKLSLGEPMDIVDPKDCAKRKDANEKTEMTLLNPAIIPMSLEPANQQILHDIFQFYLDEITAVKNSPTFVLQNAGRRRRHISKKGRKAKKQRHSKKKAHRRR